MILAFCSRILFRDYRMEMWHEGSVRNARIQMNQQLIALMLTVAFKEIACEREEYSFGRRVVPSNLSFRSHFFFVSPHARSPLNERNSLYAVCRECTFIFLLRFLPHSVCINYLFVLELKLFFVFMFNFQRYPNDTKRHSTRLDSNGGSCTVRQDPSSCCVYSSTQWMRTKLKIRVNQRI